MRSDGATSPLRIAGVAIPLAIGLAMAFAVLRVEHDQARAESAAAIRATVASSIESVRTEIRAELDGAAGRPAVRTVAADRLAGAPISADAAITARDSGTATLDDSARPPAMIVPIYRGATTPADTAARRAAIVSYQVVALTLGPTIATLQPVSGGLLVTGPDRIVASAPGPPPAGALRYGVDLGLPGAPGWTVQSWQVDPGTPGVAWVWASLVLIVFAAMALVIGVLQRREDAAASRVRTFERNRGLYAGIASVTQASLDLAEVAPAVASRLSDGLNLAGLSLSTPGDNGERQLFTWGTPPDPRTRPLARPPSSVPAGRTFAIALTRAGRTLGTLRIVAREPLGSGDIMILDAVGDTLGSAFANAEAFARQQELVDRMRSVDELKTVFLATASHELRTPVTAIVGFSTLLLERWDSMGPAQQRGLLERVQANGNRLNLLIEQLLDFSQLERGLPRASDEVLDLGATVTRILAEQPELRAGHGLVVDAPDGCRVRGSSSAVERIVTNLVGNAAKYSPTGTTIRVTVQPQGEHAVVLVDDEGAGVPVEDRDKVFSRFYRGRGDSVARTRGAGIGLAIVSEYAASMSGHVRVAEAPGGGARFVVSFPMITPLTDPHHDRLQQQGEADVAVS